MNTFRTVFDVPGSEHKISYQSKSFYTGSCFTENIGNYLQALKFPVCVNPFGILYNPMSIFESLRSLINKKEFTKEDLILNKDIWCSLHHHGRFSDTDKNNCLDNINRTGSSASEFLKKAGFLFITFGTSYAYRHKEKKMIVANCHKFPAPHFEKILLDVDTIVHEFKSLEKLLLKFNPDIKIILTVSPVRHINDGIVENQLSKSILHVAIHKIISDTKNCFYFPAYELQMDDLRDYRFYGADMAHPNEIAIGYIRKKFIETYIDKDSQNILAEIEKLLAAKNHRTFHPESITSKAFLNSHAKKTNALKQEFPFLDLKEFEDYFGISQIS
jgi:hypothetical protein